MPRECRSPAEFPAAYVAGVRSLAGVDPCVTIEIIETSKARLTGGADVVFLFALRAQVRTKILIAQEDERTVLACEVADRGKFLW